MQERITGHKIEWTRLEISPGHFIETRPIDPAVLEKMPEVGAKPYTQTSLFELALQEIKRAFGHLG